MIASDAIKLLLFAALIFVVAERVRDHFRAKPKKVEPWLPSDQVRRIVEAAVREHLGDMKEHPERYPTDQKHRAIVQRARRHLYHANLPEPDDGAVISLVSQALRDLR